jgi:hypothetical protein
MEVDQMPKPGENPNDVHRTHSASMTGVGDETRTARGWEEEESWWRDNYAKRPYVTRERDFEYYRPGYRYGYESAQRFDKRSWRDVESELRSGWDKYEYGSKSAWEEIKESVRDAWDHLRGDEHESHQSRRS